MHYVINLTDNVVEDGGDRRACASARTARNRSQYANRMIVDTELDRYELEALVIANPEALDAMRVDVGARGSRRQEVDE